MYVERDGRSGCEIGNEHGKVGSFECSNDLSSKLARRGARCPGASHNDDILLLYMMRFTKLVENPVDITDKVSSGLGKRVVDLEHSIVDNQGGLFHSGFEGEGDTSRDGFSYRSSV